MRIVFRAREGQAGSAATARRATRSAESPRRIAALPLRVSRPPNRRPETSAAPSAFALTTTPFVVPPDRWWGDGRRQRAADRDRRRQDALSIYPDSNSTSSAGQGNDGSTVHVPATLISNASPTGGVATRAVERRGRRVLRRADAQFLQKYESRCRRSWMQRGGGGAGFLFQAWPTTGLIDREGQSYSTRQAQSRRDCATRFARRAFGRRGVGREDERRRRRRVRRAAHRRRGEARLSRFLRELARGASGRGLARFQDRADRDALFEKRRIHLRSRSSTRTSPGPCPGRQRASTARSCTSRHTPLRRPYWRWRAHEPVHPSAGSVVVESSTRRP